MMHTYWKINTSTESHVSKFITATKFNVSPGDKIIIDHSENKYTKLTFENKYEIQFHKNTISQILTVWEAIGIIYKRENGEFIVICPFKKIDEIFEYSKSFLFRKVESKKINNYLFTKIVNTLILAGLLTISDLNEMSIEAKKAKITSDDIKEETGIYEEFLAKDQNILEKAKRRMQNENF